MISSKVMQLIFPFKVISLLQFKNPPRRLQCRDILYEKFYTSSLPRFFDTDHNNNGMQSHLKFGLHYFY